MKTKYKYILYGNLIYRIKPDWQTTGFNEYLSAYDGTWHEGLPSKTFAVAKWVRSISPQAIKFFEQDGGYDYYPVKT